MLTDEMVEAAAREIATILNPWGASAWKEYEFLARAALTAAQSAGSASGAEGWRDIASAPKDGTRILGYGPHDSAPGYYIGDVYYWQEHWPIKWMHGHHEPTHWMPLPPPPARKGGEG